MEDVGLWAGLILTLMIFSYIIADTFLYRLAVSILVGMVAAYSAIVIAESLLFPWFESTLSSGDETQIGLGLLPLLLLMLLMLKNARWPWLARLGNLGLAVVIAVGTATALVGALTGTILPFAESTINAAEGELANALIALIGVVTTLLYFVYIARRAPTGEIKQARLITLSGFVGQVFIAVTLGALYGAAILTTLTVFSERISAVIGHF
jgi:hypothetical protein